MASAEVIFLIVVTADPIYLDCWVINTRKNKKTHNLLQVVNRRETALFRADEPTGNNAVLTVHIKHDSNHVLCCVNSTYHAWYQYCFISRWIYNLFFFQGLRDYFLYYRET